MQPSIGRIVHYRLSPDDVSQISRRRTTGGHIRERMEEGFWPTGAQAHIGNPVEVDQSCPMVITAVINDELVNGQVFLDGCDVFWATSRKQGFAPGTWNWPEIKK